MIDQPFFIPALIIGAMAIPLVFGFIPPNRVYGVRTRRTLADEKAWYAVNRAAGMWVLVSSGLYLGFAVLCPMAGKHDPRFGLWLAHLGFFALPLLVGVLCLGNRKDEGRSLW